MIIWDEMGSNHRDIDQAADRDEAMYKFHDGEIFKGKGDWRQHSQLFLAGNLRKREMHVQIKSSHLWTQFKLFG
jgi:hypothetical protein